MLFLMAITYDLRIPYLNCLETEVFWILHVFRFENTFLGAEFMV
jgi:hypothetical protein